MREVYDRAKNCSAVCPGREVYDDEGNVSCGTFPPVALVKK